MTGGGREGSCERRGGQIDVVPLLVDARVVELVRRGVDVSVVHVPFQSREGIGRGCLLEGGGCSGLRATQGRWCDGFERDLNDAGCMHHAEALRPFLRRTLENSTSCFVVLTWSSMA